MVTHFDRRSALHDKEILNMLVITCRGSRETVHTCKYRAEEILGYLPSQEEHSPPPCAGLCHLPLNLHLHGPFPVTYAHTGALRYASRNGVIVQSLSVESNANDDMQKIMFPPLTKKNLTWRDPSTHGSCSPLKTVSCHRIQLEACSHHQQLLA